MVGHSTHHNHVEVGSLCGAAGGQHGAEDRGPQKYLEPGVAGAVGLATSDWTVLPGQTSWGAAGKAGAAVPPDACHGEWSTFRGVETLHKR